MPPVDLERPQRILVLTAEEGEGHYSASRALEAELAGIPGVQVTVHDALREGFGRVVPFFTRDSYRVQLRFFPWTYGIEYFVFTKLGLARGLARAGLAALGGRPLSRLIARFGPDLIVSTHPAVTSVLGYLRRRNRLRVPTVATITDLGVHPFWAHRGVDLHLVMHEACIPSVERIAGEGSARVAGPIVAPAFRASRGRGEAREVFDLPSNGAVIVVSGGGWGVGDVERAARAALAIEDATVVCVSGKNAVLQARLSQMFADEPRVRVLGFTERMRDLLAAADVLVDSTVGLTCLEALTCACPLVVYGAPPGHSRDSAREFARLGLAEVVGSSAELGDALRRSLGRTDSGMSALPPAPSAGSLILQAGARVRPIPAWRRRLAPAAAALAATLGLTAWTVASPTPYPLVSRALGLRPLTIVHTGLPVVGLVVEAPPSSVQRVARTLERHGAGASFAVRRAPDRRLLAELDRLGDDLLPVCRSAAFAHWLSLRTNLSSEARRLGLQNRFYYLAPRDFTIADYLAARTVGGSPVSGAVGVVPGTRIRPKDLRPGLVIVVEWRTGASLQALDSLLSSLSGRGLQPVSLGELLASARSTAATAADRATSTMPASTAASDTARPARASG